MTPPAIESGGFHNLAGQLGLGQGTLEISRLGSRRVRRFSNITGRARRVTLTPPDPTRQNLTHEKKNENTGASISRVACVEMSVQCPEHTHRSCWEIPFVRLDFLAHYIVLALFSRPLQVIPTNSDPRSNSGPSFPLPTTVSASIFIVRRIQHVLPSSTRLQL